MQELRDRLNQLRALDRRHEIFGAPLHRYRQIPVSPEEVEQLERELHISLPPFLRRFFLEVGAGAGPYYGLWSPGRILEEMRGARRYRSLEDDDDPGVLPRPGRSFPLNREHLQEIRRRLSSGQESPHERLPGTPDGCIVLCHHGCDAYSVLVTTGDLAGTVWDVECYDAAPSYWLPARRPPGLARAETAGQSAAGRAELITVQRWIEGWLEQALADLSNRR